MVHTYCEHRDSPSTSRVLARCPDNGTDVSVWVWCQECEKWKECFGEVGIEAVLQEAYWRDGETFF